MVAKARYTPIGDAISPEATIVQAAIALDVAAQWAVERKDIEQMNTVALGWTELSKVLMAIEEEPEGPPADRNPLGFYIPVEEEENGRVDTEDTDEPQG